jgi:hypothetical protein
MLALAFALMIVVEKRYERRQNKARKVEKAEFTG